MSVDTETRVVPVPDWLTVRLAAAVIAGGGRLTAEQAAQIARETLSATKRPLGLASEALRPLIADEVLVNVDRAWYAPSLADLAAYLSDGIEAREAAGLRVNPSIPGPRDGHRRSA